MLICLFAHYFNAYLYNLCMPSAKLGKWLQLKNAAMWVAKLAIGRSLSQFSLYAYDGDKAIANAKKNEGADPGDQFG